ncbi:MAG: hypothetical protein LC804_16985 [Acidobacteria bacterium]|nr:hypothetical protein [Acidobacteriota bacterium]
MPKLNVTDVNRIATAAARQESADLHVVGVTVNSGGSDYVEVVLDIHGCRDEPCHSISSCDAMVAACAVACARLTLGFSLAMAW